MIVVDQLDECDASEAWLRKWWPQLSFVSESRGCGCCIHIWDIECPDEAIPELPPDIMTTPEPPSADARNLRSDFASFPEDYF